MEGDFDMKIGKILKKGITKVINPYIPGIPTGNNVLRALDNTFLQQGQVFEGSIWDFINFAEEYNIPEATVRTEFQDLEKVGWIEINDDTFIPQSKLLERYS